jgi:hypothetical protein
VQTAGMRPRDVLAENLIKLMAASANLRTVEALVAAGAGTTGTLDRIKRKEAATGVDNLEPIARVFGLGAWWQLLVPTLEAKPGADGLPEVSGLPTWPMDRVDVSRYLALDVADRMWLQARFDKDIEACEQRAKIEAKANLAKKSRPAGKTGRTPRKRHGNS